jgi:histidinol-phosphate aminotransferase
MDVPEYIPGRTIDEIKEKYNLKKVYKLASNESLFGPDYGVLKEIRKNLRNIKYYPDGSCIEIRKKISEKFSIDINSVIIGNGTDQIIEMICDSFIGEGDNIVISDPTFLIYEKSTLKCNGIVVKVRLKKLSQDVEELVKSINDKTKILFITNPHNPTGSKLGFSEFDYIMENVNQDVLVVMDEAYRDYMAEEDKIDTVSYVSRHNNLIILRTFSKIYGLAGLRIGYGISDNKVISALNKVRLPFNVSSIAQKAAVKAMENESYVNKIRGRVEEEKNRYYKILNENGIGFARSYANFILIKTGRDSDIIVERLLREGFIVRPGRNLGIPGYIRVTMGLPGINKIFLKTFVKIFNDVCSKERF